MLLHLRFPLLPKILIWLLLNLAVLGAAIHLVVRLQFQFGLDSLLAGRAGGRVQAVSDVITDELKAKSVSSWDEVLQRFGKAYQVQFFLFRPDGSQVAGATMDLPTEVAAKVAERPNPGAGVRRGPPPGRGPRWTREESDVRPEARFVVRTSNPTGYWIGIRLPLAEPGTSRPWPLTLLLNSSSLSAGGLFFDPTPWVMVGVGALVFSVLFWLPLIRGITRSLSQMTRATEQISEGWFETRVNDRRGDELGRLGLAINRMAVRLAGFVTGQKRVLGDIAHELCSPLARIQVALGILEQRTDDKQQTYMHDLREEVEQMSRLVNELLSFSKAGLTPQAVQLEPVNLAATVQRVLEQEAAPTLHLHVQVPDGLTVMAQPELLFRALANLIRNALRYADPAGPIIITAERKDDTVIIGVADEGPGIPEESLPQVFDPFFRGEPSRSRATGGTGLGLAIVKACVEACRGTVSAKNRKPRGLEVLMTLSVPT